MHVHPLSFRTPLGQNPNIEQYQVRQTETGARIGVIAIDIVGKLERHRETGKLKRFVPLARHNL